MSLLQGLLLSRPDPYHNPLFQDVMLVFSRRSIRSDFTRGGFFLSQSATILLGKLDQYGACTMISATFAAIFNAFTIPISLIFNCLLLRFYSLIYILTYKALRGNEENKEKKNGKPLSGFFIADLTFRQTAYFG